MLLIHWTKHNNTSAILQNGINPALRTSVAENLGIKGIWCFPYTRNKTLNIRWKSMLKIDRGSSNYNGLVFKLTKSDFPIYAGDLGVIRMAPDKRQFNSYKSFSKQYGHYFSPKTMSMEYSRKNEINGVPDYFDFEIILLKPIDATRIIKILKDRH